MRNQELACHILETISFKKKDSSHFVTAFHFHPEHVEQEKLGTFFGIIKINDTNEESSFVKNLLTSVLRKEYYSRSERPALESFESALKKANLALGELARSGSIRWIGKIMLAAAVFERRNLHFSISGNAKIILIRASQIADIGEPLSDHPKENSHPLKTFSSVSSGKLEKGDLLVLATEELFDIFSLEELRQNVRRFSFEDFFSMTKDALSQNAEMAPLCVVSIQEKTEAALNNHSQESPRKESFPAKERKAESAANNESHEEKGHSMSEGKFLSKIQEAPSANPPGRPANKTGEIILPKNDALRIRERDIIPPKIAKINFYGIAKKINGFFQNLIFIISSRAKALRQSTPHPFSGKINSSSDVFILRISSRLKDINRNKLRILVTKKSIGIFFGGLIVISFLFLFSFNNRKTADDEANTAEISEIIPQNEVYPDIKISEVSVKNIAELENAPQAISFFDEYLILAGSQKKITLLDPKNMQSSDFPSTFDSGEFISLAPMPDLNFILILTNKNEVLSFFPSNKKFQQNQMDVPTGSEIISIETYLTYLYALDQNSKQILRYPRAEGGFGIMQNWLRGETLPDDAIGFAVNENLFLATKKGEIISFSQGKIVAEPEFQASQEPLSPMAIETQPDFEYIYVLDAENHRVVKYAKNGEIIRQYWNAEISGDVKLAVDEENKTVYLAKENKLLKFSLE